MNTPTINGLEYNVLGHGFIKVIDHMGDDYAIVDAARLSYQKGTTKLRTDTGLINYLLRKGHWTPFQMCELKIQVKLPIFVMRQWIRHTGDINEYSLRYSEPHDHVYLPELKRLCKQSKTNKQGSGEPLTPEAAEFVQGAMAGVSDHCLNIYKHLTKELGLARELARNILPLCTYTEMVWKTNLRNFLIFVKQRADSHAQWEIQQYANIIYDIIKQWCPVTAQAFQDYHIDAITLTAHDIKALKAGNQGDIKGIFPTDREYREFVEKCSLINLPI